MDKLRSLLEKLKWSTVLVLIVACGAYSYYTLDQEEIDAIDRKIESTKNEITSTEKKIAEAKEFERQFEEKKKRYAELVRELQKLQGALPRSFYLPDLLADFISEAKDLEIEITKLEPDDHEQQSELYNTLGFNIEAKGTFLQFFIFLDRLANMKRLVNVHTFNIDKDSERKNVALGGAEGAFAERKLEGGRIVYPGLKADIRLLTYRYNGTLPMNGSPPPAPKGGK